MTDFSKGFFNNRHGQSVKDDDTIGFYGRYDSLEWHIFNFPLSNIDSLTQYRSSCDILHSLLPNQEEENKFYPPLLLYLYLISIHTIEKFDYQNFSFTDYRFQELIFSSYNIISISKYVFGFTLENQFTLKTKVEITKYVLYVGKKSQALPQSGRMENM